ncbi:hypothetical protein N431DRAFT_470765 [Stipitochalara longipes BDJ]|nr:hypothetical protein N431DRAFT_470765 [Stipitochalara longipes BDJ]
MPEEDVSRSHTPQPRRLDSNSSTSVPKHTEGSTVNSDSLNYKPVPLRWPVFVSLFLFIGCLLGLLEYVQHMLPATKGSGDNFQASLLSPSMAIPGFGGQPVIAETSASKLRKEAALSKRPSVSYPTVAPRRYLLGNETGPQSDNQTGLGANTSTPEVTYSHCGAGHLVGRGCSYQDPGNYANAAYGPIVHVAILCGWEQGPPGQSPLYPAVDGETLDENPCQFRLWWSNDTSDCPYQTVNNGDLSIPFSEAAVTGGDGDVWFLMSLRAEDSWVPGIDRCDTTNSLERCLLPCAKNPSPDSPKDIPSVTQIFRILEDITSTNQIAAFETTITTVSTGTDGRPTTLIRTATVGASASTFTTSGAVFVTAIRPAGGKEWTQLSQTTMDGISGHSASAASDTLPPGVTNHPIIVTLMDPHGVPMSTVTDYLETLLDSNGVPTATLTVSLETLTDSNGLPTKTLMEYTAATNTTMPFAYAPPKHSEGKTFVPVSNTRYFIGSFLPILMAVLLAILIQLVDKNLKFMLPFYALMRPSGATAADSICMIPGGLYHLPRSILLLYRLGEPLALLSDLLVLLSALLVSVSGEAIELKVYGICKPESFTGCYLSLVALNAPSRVAQALMVLMVVALALIWIFISRVRSGIAGNPWTIAASASLLSAETGNFLQQIRARGSETYINESQILGELRGKTFALRNYKANDGKSKYGIIIRNEGNENESNQTPRAVKRTLTVFPTKKTKHTRKNCLDYFTYQLVWDYGVRGILLAILSGLLILILYYNTKMMDPMVNHFEYFMDSQKFGVRFLFSALGVVITFFWDSIFSRMIMMQPYRYLSGLHPYTKAGISVSPATTVFPALWRALLQRDPFAFMIAFAGALSKFTPILLSNIPFRSTQTWQTHVTCAWMTVTFLAFMIIVLLWSFFAKWPYLPVGPNTIAGNLYYVCDSPILGDFEGMSIMNEKERDAQIKRSELKYRFGTMKGVSGKWRVGVSYDTCNSKEEA